MIWDEVVEVGCCTKQTELVTSTTSWGPTLVPIWETRGRDAFQLHFLIGKGQGLSKQEGRNEAKHTVRLSGDITCALSPTFHADLLELSILDILTIY